MNRNISSLKKVVNESKGQYKKPNLFTIAPFKARYGPGGRSSNSGITATVFGAYGFLGRYLVNELGACGSRVYVPFRGCELEVRHLKPMFDLGGLGLLPFSTRDDESIIQSLKHSDVVINLIGKHYETKHLVPTRRSDGKLSRINYSFDEVHNQIPAKLARLAKEAGVKNFIHVSAMSADLNSASAWSRTKALGEVALRKEFPDAIIVRPATMFGPEDRFLNWIAEATEKLSVTPLINGGSTLMQPVWAVDVGKALAMLVYNCTTLGGKTFLLAGPAEYSMKEIVEFVSDVTTVKKRMVNIPMPLAKYGGKFLEQTINPFWTEDMYYQSLEDNILDKDLLGENVHTMADLGIEAASMDRVAFDYLHRFRPGGHFTIVKGYY